MASPSRRGKPPRRKPDAAPTLSARHYIVAEGRLRPIAHDLLARVRGAQAALPRYAGAEVRLLDVTVALRGGKPARVLDIAPTRLKFDARGRIASPLQDQLRASLRADPAALRWKPSRQEIARATALALGRERSRAQRLRAG